MELPIPELLRFMLELASQLEKEKEEMEREKR